MKYPKLNANILWCLVMLCISLLVGMAIPGHLTITKTRSVKYHLFWEIDRKTPQKGDYVRLPLFEPKVGCAPCSIVKRSAVCQEIGWSVKVLNTTATASFWVNAKTGKNIAPFQFSGTVPPGMVFLVGDRDNSYDSRYFGFKQIADIETVLFPLF